MKKFIYIFIAFFAVFYGINIVSAKDCYYGSGYTYKAKIDTSTGKGTIKYKKNNGKYKGDNEDVQNWSKDKKRNDATIKKYSSNACPKYVLIANPSNGFHLYASNSKDELEAFKKKQTDWEIQSIINSSTKEKYEMSASDDISDNANKTDWDLSCTYICPSKKHISLNYKTSNKKFNVYSSSNGSSNTTLKVTDDLKDNIDSSCPSKVYLSTAGVFINESVAKDQTTYKGPAAKGSAGNIEIDGCYFSNSGSNSSGSGSNSSGSNGFDDDPDVDIKTCEDLIGKEMIDEINNILFYVKILVPILILVLGSLDFGKAVLAGNEDNMKKAQSTFIKRLIIGVAIFFIPSLINLIIDIMNTVWGFGDNCGIK